MLGGYTTYNSITTRTTKEEDATGNVPSVPQDRAAGGGLLEDEVGAAAAAAAAAEGRRSLLLFRRTIPPRSVAALLVGLLASAVVLVALSSTDLRGAGDGGIGGMVVSWRSSSSTDTHQRGREELPMEDADDSEKQQPIEWEEYMKQNPNNDEGDDDNNDDDDDDDDDDDGYGIFGRCSFDDAIPLPNLPRFHHNQGVKFEVNDGKYFCFLECNDADSCFTHLHISCTKEGGTHADVWFKTNERCLMCSSQGIEYELMMRNNGWHELGILWPDFPGQSYLYINEVRYCPL